MDWQFSISLCTEAGDIIRGALTVLAHYAEDQHFAQLRPVRKPAAYKNQRHLPGLLYMARLRRSLPYESRLEMMALKQLDFDPSLVAVLPQPCTIHFKVDNGTYKHTPDFLVWRERCIPMLVDVKPRRYVTTEYNQRAFTAAKAAAESIGFIHTIQTELQPTYLANLNWISAYRRLPARFHCYASELINRAAATPSFARLLHGLTPRALVLPAVFHLLWLRKLEFDMQKILSDHTVISLAR